jgi:peroxiredoxin
MLALVFVMNGFSIEEKAPVRYSLMDERGSVRTDAEWRRSRAAVFFFIGTQCPISNRYAPEINRLVDAYARKGIAFYAVQSDPDVDAALARKYAEEFGYKFPSLLDPEQQLAKRFNVLTSPTAVIVSPRGGLIYRGRIDDRHLDFGKTRSAGVRPELQLAMDAVLAGRQVLTSPTPPVGCALPPAKKTGVSKR